MSRWGSRQLCLQDAEKAALLTRQTPAGISPSRPESAKTDSLPWDAPFPVLRSRLIEILNVPHSGNELSWQLGDGRVRKGTPPVSTRLRPCWTDFLSIVRDTHLFFMTRGALSFLYASIVFFAIC